jgi:DNA-binding transcriptional regulator YiaG
MLRVNRDSLAEEIRVARDRAALSQVELAQKLGVSARTIQGWEAGRIPQPKHRRALLEFVKEAA